MATKKQKEQKLALDEIQNAREKAKERDWLRAKKTSNEQNIIDAGRQK